MTTPRIAAYRKLLKLAMSVTQDDAVIAEIVHAAHDIEDCVRAEENESTRVALAYMARMDRRVS